ncbi:MULTISPECIES: hypothetical protein [Treponema]|jgi:hypothetical protein|uniref:Uncharacterized protein n=2 Tax=root TaxID=1 RepID=Q73NK1_TREDE|nr:MULTISPECIES: hypothetical protein [Treponema]DAD70579.1 MAG TPA: hypothetical protein [Podoviridae sp. ctvSF8]AAS11640.1 hypothetical protein TDE_1151 [Treponema denticola ATCC 35405]UTC88057.1 hypothetical protein E4N79_07860 [Treponema denticola]UTC93065.1 hypothetical protein E4N84_08160 [Treponema denticola]HCY96446.1 hypothetical protein [Treponema sp.]
MSKCVIPGYETSSPDEQIEALRKTFKRVFKTEDGKIIFNALLNDLFYFTEAKTEAEKALCEYAKFFLRERLGIIKTLNITNSLIDNLD